MKEIAILSGKGGTGKTSLSAAFATLGNNVVVADCDVEAANLHLVLLPEKSLEAKFLSGYKAKIDATSCTNCGICIDFCRFDAISWQNVTVKITETMCDGCKLCSRVCPEQAIEMVASDKSRWYAGNFRNGKMVHARLSPGEENSGKLVNVVRNQAKKIASEYTIGTIIIDGPPGTGCPAISSVTGVQKAIIITEPTRSGFHDLKRVIELTNNFNINTEVIINRYDLNTDISGVIFDWCSENNIPVIGKIPFDAAMVEAMVNCQSIVEWQPGSPAGKEIIKIWKSLKLN